MACYCISNGAREKKSGPSPHPLHIHLLCLRFISSTSTRRNAKRPDHDMQVSNQAPSHKFDSSNPRTLKKRSQDRMFKPIALRMTRTSVTVWALTRLANLCTSATPTASVGDVGSYCRTMPKKINDALLLMKRKAKEEANNTAVALALLKKRGEHLNV